MKLLLLILFSIVTGCLTAQNINDTIQSVFYLPGNVNVTVRLLNKSNITGDVWRFTDSSLMIYGRNNKGDMVFKHINYTEMRSVKIKRYAFVKGLAVGAGTGSLISQQMFNQSDANYEPAGVKEGAQALAVMASASVIGGVLSSAVTKKKFKIKGKKRNFEPVFEVLMLAHP